MSYGIHYSKRYDGNKYSVMTVLVTVEWTSVLVMYFTQTEHESSYVS